MKEYVNEEKEEKEEDKEERQDNLYMLSIDSRPQGWNLMDLTVHRKLNEHVV